MIFKGNIIELWKSNKCVRNLCTSLLLSHLRNRREIIDLTHISLFILNNSELWLIMRNIFIFGEELSLIQICHILLQRFQRLDVCVSHSTCKSPETFISACYCQNYLLSDKINSNIRILQKSCFSVTIFQHP